MWCFAIHEWPGQHPFKELARYALDCLSVPVSNGIVERVFSYVTSVKTKSRNRMNLSLLDSIVTIRSVLHFQEKWCKDFVVTRDMLSLFNNSIYDSHDPPHGDDVFILND